MLKFKDISGHVFTGKDYKAVVRGMKKKAWVVVPKREYTRQVANRLKVLGTTNISVVNSEEFVKSLVATGWLKPVKSVKKTTTTK